MAGCRSKAFPQPCHVTARAPIQQPLRYKEVILGSIARHVSGRRRYGGVSEIILPEIVEPLDAFLHQSCVCACGVCSRVACGAVGECIVFKCAV